MTADDSPRLSPVPHHAMRQEPARRRETEQTVKARYPAIQVRRCLIGWLVLRVQRDGTEEVLDCCPSEAEAEAVGRSIEH